MKRRKQKRTFKSRVKKIMALAWKRGYKEAKSGYSQDSNPYIQRQE